MRVVDRRTEERERVHLADPGVDHLGVVVIPACLVLFGSAVVIDGEQHDTHRFGGIAEPDRRTPTVRTDLEHRRPGNGAACSDRCIPQRVALVGGHEPLGRERQVPTLWRHQVSQWMIVSGSGRIARLKSVPTV